MAFYDYSSYGALFNNVLSTIVRFSSYKKDSQPFTNIFLISSTSYDSFEGSRYPFETESDLRSQERWESVTSHPAIP